MLHLKWMSAVRAHSGGMSSRPATSRMIWPWRSAISGSVSRIRSPPALPTPSATGRSLPPPRPAAAAAAAAVPGAVPAAAKDAAGLEIREHAILAVAELRGALREGANTVELAFVLPLRRELQVRVARAAGEAAWAARVHGRVLAAPGLGMLVGRAGARGRRRAALRGRLLRRRRGRNGAFGTEIGADVAVLLESLRVGHERLDVREARDVKRVDGARAHHVGRGRARHRRARDGAGSMRRLEADGAATRRARAAGRQARLALTGEGR